MPKSHRFSNEEYFALERESERRFEYRDGEIVCMSGGTREHAAIAGSIARHLGNQLYGKCQVYGSDLAIYVPGGLPYRYPDGSVVCGELRIRSVDGRDCLENPKLLIEILSETSADFDRGTKFEEYKTIPDLVEYLLVAQDRPHAARRTKAGPETWTETVFESLDATIGLESVGADLRMRDIYEHVSFG
jgi:Uma2 family endonuclease